MRLEGLRWRALISTVRLGRDEYRVVRPARPIEHAPLHEGYLGVQMTVDKTSALQLGAAWSLAARSPHTIVHLPLRHNDRSCSPYGTGDEPLLDLVLLHHSLRFPVSRWKQVRAALGPGRPHMITSTGLPVPSDADYEAAHHRGFKDVLRHSVAAGTLFLTGSRKAFDLEGRRLHDLIDECPRHMHATPDAHCCAELDVSTLPRYLHVEYCPVHRVAAPSSF
ncbi:hypothetical protein ACWDOP_11025 [Nocardia sp. NPDC003693]